MNQESTAKLVFPAYSTNLVELIKTIASAPTPARKRIAPLSVVAAASPAPSTRNPRAVLGAIGM
jgi:hypothetical protein